MTHRIRLAPPVLALVLLATSLLPAPAAAEAFQPRVDHVARPIVDAGTVWTGERVILLGGRNASGPTDLIQSYDPATGESRVLDARLPQRTQSAATAWTGEAAYLFGGAHLVAMDDPTGTSEFVVEVRPHDTIVRFDPATGTARTLNTTLPDAVFGMSAVWTGERVLLFGGMNRTRGDDGSMESYTKDWILAFDPDAPQGQRLERVGSLPSPIRDLQSTWTGSAALLMGGMVETRQDGQRVFLPSDRVLRYTPGASSVEVLEPRLPTTLRWAGSATFDGSAYLFGGCRDACDDPARHQLETVVQVDLATGQSQRLHPTLPTPRIAPGVVATSEELLVLGGGRGPQRYDEVFDDVLRFTPGPTPPLAPANVTADASREGVTVSWRSPTYDGGANLTAYHLERARPGSGFRTVATVDPNATAATDPLAPVGLNLTYRVRAVNPAGPGQPSPPVHATPPPRAPSAPQRFDAVGVRDGVVLRWDPPQDTGGRSLEAYEVLRDGNSVANVTATAWTDRNLTWNTTHAYEVRAWNQVGAGPAAGPVDAQRRDRLAPPRNLTVQANEDSVRLTWSPPAEGNVTHYTVLRGDAWDALEPLENTTVTRWTEDGLAPGEVRWYAVRAVGPDGVGAPTSSREAVHVVPPGPPRDLRAETAPGRVTLSWAPPASAGGADTLYYNVLRGGDEEVSPTYLNPDFWTETSLRDDDVAPGTTVTYRVEAVNAAGTGPRANLTVHVPETNTPPVAALSTSSLRAEVGELVRFDASGSTDADGRVVRARFTFGDGTDTGWTTAFQPLHRYTAPGAYNVTLHVRDDAGAVSRPANATVVVAEPRSTTPPPSNGSGNGTPGGGTEPEPRDRGVLGVPGVGPWVLVSLLLAAMLRRPAGRRRR